MTNPNPTRYIRANWLSQIEELELLSRASSCGIDGLERLLYHDVLDQAAHGTRDVKKLSKHSESAADHAQMNNTSKRV
jgi:hypothetical protein